MAAEFALDYELEYGYSKTNAAPALEPQVEEESRQNLQKLKKHRPGKRELERVSYVKVAKAFALMALAIALAGVFCNSLVERDRSRENLKSSRTELAMYVDENIVLQNKLSKLVTAENIDKIATQKLGLVKIASSNETYLDSGKNNEVLFSQGQ